MRMKNKIIVTMITLAMATGAVACSNVKSETNNNSAGIEDSTVEAVASMESLEEVAEEVTEEASVEASDDVAKPLADEERKKMHAMLDPTGYLEGNSYENSFFNVRFDLDDNYIFSTVDELKELNGIDGDFNNDPALTQYISAGNMVVVAHASDKTDATSANNIFEVMIQGVELEVGMSGNEEAFLEECKSSVLPSLPNATAEIENITFLGKEHPSLYIKANVNGVDVYKRYVCLFKPQLVSLYSVTGLDADTFDEVIKNAEMVQTR